MSDYARLPETPWMNYEVPIVPEIVQQHVDEAASLHDIRSALVRAPHASLRIVQRFDLRLEAHLEGLAVAGSGAATLCRAALEHPSVGAVFVATVHALERRSAEQLGQVRAVAQTVTESCRGLLSAFGWTSGQQLRGIARTLLGSSDPFDRFVGVAACGMHRVDPGLTSGRWFEDVPRVRARALRAAGAIGLDRALPACLARLDDEDVECQFWAIWSSVLLGDRGRALEHLRHLGLREGPFRPRALSLGLQASTANDVHSLLKQLAKEARQPRWLIRSAGIAGDVFYVPWLIKQMSVPETARLAAEAFSVMAGVDLPTADLEGERPEDFEAGPNDDPDDPNVEMDPDDGLPWPDVEKIKNWWAANGSRFQPGTRCFMGAPVTREHCLDVLKNGYQRQRILAAHYLCLLEPGTPLFNTSAPAWRQQRLLAKMA